MTGNSQQDGYNSAKTDRNKNFAYKPCKESTSSIEPCREKDKFKIVELVEVVVHNGKETTRTLQERKQFIHSDPKLDPDKSHPDYGRSIKLKARVEWVSGSSSRQPIGRIIKWSYQCGPKNQKDLSGEDKEGFDCKGGSKTKETCTDAKGWSPVVEFYLSDPVDQWKSKIPSKVPKNKKRLSQYDKDTFTIKATDENQESISTGMLTVIGLIDWLPGMPQLKDPDIPTLRAFSSIPIGIVLHCGDKSDFLAEYFNGIDKKEGRPVSAHFAWSRNSKKFMQMVDLDIVASHAGGTKYDANKWWGIEMSGPAYKKEKGKEIANPRTVNEWDLFDRILKRDTGFLHLASGGHLKYYCFHKDILLKKQDLGPDSMKKNIEDRTGLIWGMPPDGTPGKTVQQLELEKKKKVKKVAKNKDK